MFTLHWYPPLLNPYPWSGSHSVVSFLHLAVSLNRFGPSFPNPLGHCENQNEMKANDVLAKFYFYSLYFLLFIIQLCYFLADEHYLIDINSFKIYFHYRGRDIGWIFNMTKLSMSWINIYYWHYRCEFPCVGSSTIKVGTYPFYWAWCLVRA